MSDFTVNGASILSGEVTFVFRGRWSFTGQIDSAGPPAVTMAIGDRAQVLIVNEDGSSKVLSGTISDYAEWQGRAGVRVVAGAGGLGVPLPPQGYVAHPLPVPVLDLLEDIAGLTGETLSAATREYAATITVGSWSRVGDGVAALDALGAEFELDWRMNDSGEIDFVPTTWPEATPDDMLHVNDEGADGVLTVAPAAANDRPGTTISGRRILEVVYLLEPGKLREQLVYHQGERGELERAVRRQLPELPFSRPYAGTVTAVNSDGTLQVQTDEMGALDRVELLVGSPAMKVTPAVGDAVRVAYSSARPSQFFAFAVGQDSEATKGVARADDEVDLGWLSATAPPGGGPCTLLLSPAEVPNSVHLIGKITTAHPRVMLTDEGQ